MKYDYIENLRNLNCVKHGMPVTVGDVVVQVVFAGKENTEAPEIVGKILKDVCLHRKSL